MPRRIFSVDEANALLPLLEGVLRELEHVRDEIRRRRDHVAILDALWGDKLMEPANPDHAELLAHRDAIEAAAREIQRIVEDEISGRGIRFPQGGLEHGLLDFPTIWEGRWVYLCWRRGEPEVRAWHETDGGFAGRREITPEQRLRMGRDDADA
ncbi:MAG: DUF2203 domain-containing protein [Gemmatimonadetes bacterium]|nr:DUF2203 domain-containing protein [Gemmatimonadota bacterium]